MLDVSATTDQAPSWSKEIAAPPQPPLNGTKELSEMSRVQRPVTSYSIHFQRQCSPLLVLGRAQCQFEIVAGM